MNKVIIIILFLAGIGIWACDTPSNITPINESFFVKLYAGVGVGDQFGNDIIATSDGGLLIAGTSVNEVTNTSEILLIKTDEKGNEIWTYGASTELGAPSVSVAKSVIELSNSYLVGGTVGEGIFRKSVLIEINFDGTYIKSSIISTDLAGVPIFNVLSKITLGLSGILVTGETARFSANGGGLNGYVSLYNESTLQPEIVGTDSIWYFGVAGDDHVAGGYEVSDPNTSIGNQNSRFLIFGHSDGGDANNDNKFYYVGYSDAFGSNPTPGVTATILGDNFPGNQTAAYVTQFNDTYWVIGDTDDNQMLLVGWIFSASAGNNWVPDGSSGNVPTNDPDDEVVGKGVAVQSSGNYVIVGDASTTDNTEIYLVRANDSFRFSSPPWPKTYGTTTSFYSASAVTTLQDGSIIIVGTADLEPIKKIIVIKTGPNGEMSF